MYRATESERSDSLVDDPYARRMAGDLGRSIVHEVPLGESMAWAVIVRTAVVDEMILDCIANGTTKVLNLAAGLDTRAFRLVLPPTLRWYDVNLPNMVAHRRACLKKVEPRCDHAYVAADVNDAAELRQVLCKARSIKGAMLVVSEACWSTSNEPRSACCPICCMPSKRRAGGSPIWSAPCCWAWWAPSGHPMKRQQAPFQIAPRDSAGFFGPLGWHETSFRFTLDEAIRLQRSPRMAQWWDAFVPPWWRSSRQNLRRMSGVALMEATKKPTTPNASRASLEALE
jgi:hypothetical protein